MRRNQGDHAVATEAKPVHPVGQPISASTNSGFKVRLPRLRKRGLLLQSRKFEFADCQKKYLTSVCAGGGYHNYVKLRGTQ